LLEGGVDAADGAVDVEGRDLAANHISKFVLFVLLRPSVLVQMQHADFGRFAEVILVLPVEHSALQLLQISVLIFLHLFLQIIHFEGYPGSAGGEEPAGGEGGQIRGTFLEIGKLQLDI
jgi:hypothetical protein